MSPAAVLPLTVALPLVAAALAPFLGPRLGARGGIVWAFAFAPAAGLLGLAPAARVGEPVAATYPWVPGIGLDLAFRADGFSLAFALLVAGIGALVLLYSAAYLGPEERHGRFYGYLLTFGGAMLGLVLSDGLIALFVFWELTSLASYLLIGFWDGRKASQDGAAKALLVTAFGGAALFAAVILLALGGHAWTLSGLDLEALRAGPYLGPALALALLAAATKSAQLPFHLWLPTAMEAPTPVSAYLHSATLVKAGVFLVAVLGPLLDGHGLARAMMALGLATLFWGAYLALQQTDLKALLAYSTVSQLGLMTSLYAAGEPFAATTHLVNHAAFKAALFMVVGLVDHQAGSRDLRQLSGLGRVMPVTALLAFPAALSMAGLPPLGGFISKEAFFEGMVHEGAIPVVVAVLASILTFAYALRFLSAFVGPLRFPGARPREARAAFWLPVAPLSLATIAFGVVPPTGTVAGWFTDLAAPALNYVPAPLVAWHGLTVALALSVLTWFVGLALHLVRDRFVRLQSSLTPGWNANTVYYAVLRGVERAAAAVTHRTQDAGFGSHVRVLVAAAAAVGAVGAWRGWPEAASPVGVEMGAAVALLLGGAAGVLVARSRMTLLVFMGLAGLGSMLAFVVLRAPDLALTQLLIEVVTVILFVSVFRYLPPLRSYTRRARTAAWDAVLAAGAGATVFTLLVAAQAPIGERLAAFLLRTSGDVGGGANVVNVILVDVRGFDTLGEITVLVVVAVSVGALLRLRAPPREGEGE